MRVRATQKGFCVRLQEAGDTFDVSSALFSARWMERLDEPEPAEPSEPDERPSEPEAKPDYSAMSIADLRARVTEAGGPTELVEATGKGARAPMIDWLTAHGQGGPEDGD